MSAKSLLEARYQRSKNQSSQLRLAKIRLSSSLLTSRDKKESIALSLFENCRFSQLLRGRTSEMDQRIAANQANVMQAGLLNEQSNFGNSCQVLLSFNERQNRQLLEGLAVEEQKLSGIYSELRLLDSRVDLLEIRQQQFRATRRVFSELVSIEEREQLLAAVRR